MSCASLGRVSAPARSALISARECPDSGMSVGFARQARRSCPPMARLSRCGSLRSRRDDPVRSVDGGRTGASSTATSCRRDRGRGRRRRARDRHGYAARPTSHEWAPGGSRRTWDGPASPDAFATGTPRRLSCCLRRSNGCAPSRRGSRPMGTGRAARSAGSDPPRTSGEG